MIENEILHPAKFDENGQISVFKKAKRELQSVEEGGPSITQTRFGKTKILKGVAVVKHEFDFLTREEDLTLFASKDDALRFVFDDDDGPFTFISMPPLLQVEPKHRLAHHISRTRANIAGNAKRGRANTIVHNAAMAVHIPDIHEGFEAEAEERREELRSYLEDPDITEESAKAVQKALMAIEIPEMFFIESEHCPEDRVLILYRGEEQDDQPLFWVEGEGLVQNSKRSDVTHYGKFIRLASIKMV